MIYAFFCTYGVSFRPLEVGYRATRVFFFFLIKYFGGKVSCCVHFNLGKVNQWFQYTTIR
jgi:hypothetical protein